MTETLFPAPWRVEHRSVPIADTGDYDCLMLVLAADNEEVAEAWNPSDEQEHAFNRIVHAVNDEHSYREALELIAGEAEGGAGVLYAAALARDALTKARRS